MHAPVPAARPPANATAAARPFIAFALLALALYSLLAHWEQHGAEAPKFSTDGSQVAFEINMAASKAQEAVVTGTGEVDVATGSTGSTGSKYNSAKHPRRVVAHFMLGNTYPFTESDWARTLHYAEKTSLDALVLNLGPEEWQLEQARVAYKLAETRIDKAGRHERPVRLFLSLDMNVLPHKTLEDAHKLAMNIAPLITSHAALRRGHHPILSTFGGEDATWGKNGWPGFIAEVNRLVRAQIFFWPGFFVSPEEFKNNPLVGGSFVWNSAWPDGNHPIRHHHDAPFLDIGKPYMAAISPLFFTHYGKNGQFAFDKNWIYRSDDLLYPARWGGIMEYKKEKAPEMVQVISWNDYGESHNIGPVMGAEPGSTAWTHRMNHDAFREMTGYYARRWRDGAPHVNDEFIVWMWYRTHSKNVVVKHDPVGRPQNADWAQDYVNVVVICPKGIESPRLEFHNGPDSKTGVHRDIPIASGDATQTLFEFVPGHVHFTLKSKAGVHINGTGHEILPNHRVMLYNFNMWSGQWLAASTTVLDPPEKPEDTPAPETHIVVGGHPADNVDEGSAGKEGSTHGHRPYMGPPSQAGAS